MPTHEVRSSGLLALLVEQWMRSGGDAPPAPTALAATPSITSTRTLVKQLAAVCGQITTGVGCVSNVSLLVDSTGEFTAFWAETVGGSVNQIAAFSAEAGSATPISSGALSLSINAGQTVALYANTTCGGSPCYELAAFRF